MQRNQKILEKFRRAEIEIQSILERWGYKYVTGECEK